MTKKIIDGVTVTADFDCPVEELENYAEFVDRNVDEPVGITWTRHNQKFERMQRKTKYRGCIK